MRRVDVKYRPIVLSVHREVIDGEDYFQVNIACPQDKEHLVWKAVMDQNEIKWDVEDFTGGLHFITLKSFLQQDSPERSDYRKESDYYECEGVSIVLRPTEDIEDRIHQSCMLTAEMNDLISKAFEMPRMKTSVVRPYVYYAEVSHPTPENDDVFDNEEGGKE